MMSKKNPECTIAVDARGRDKRPTEIIRALMYLKSKNTLRSDLILVGRKKLLERLILLKKKKFKLDLLKILDASEVIGMDEKPILALKKKKDSSMLRAIELVKNNKADAMVSCGNTGAMMAGGTIRLRPIEGIGDLHLPLSCPVRKIHLFF